jgi:hypothetical protein
MLQAPIERLVKWGYLPGSTAAGLPRTCLPLLHKVHRFLITFKAFFVVSQCPSKGVHMGHPSPRQWRSSMTNRQPRGIGYLFPLTLLLAGTLLLGAGVARAGTTSSDYGNGSCVDDDHWAKAKTDPNWTCQIKLSSGNASSTLTFEYAGGCPGQRGADALCEP